MRGVYNDEIGCKLYQDTCMCNRTLPHPKFQTTNNIFTHIIPSRTLHQDNAHYPNILLSCLSKYVRIAR